jgi:hypothetical protein
MALVVEADDPLDNLAEARLRMVRWAGPMAGPESLGVVRILIDSDPPIYVPRGFELDRDQRPPYAVFKDKFKHPDGKGGLEGSGLPALVSTSDPNDVEVLWDELLSPRKQDRQTRNAALADRDARLAQFASRAAEVASGPPPAPPAPNLLGAPQIPAEAREQMIRNAQIALRSVPAEMRSTIIEQYRLAGITIDENGKVTE